MELTGVTSQSIFDDNAADIKLSWVAGLEGADRAFDVEFAREATSAADLVGHLNLIHPNRIQVLGKPEITYYQRLDDEMRKRQMGELILLEPPFLVIADGMEPPPAVFVTGGAAEAFAPRLGSTARYEPDLVLRGVALAATHLNAQE